ncbi:MAG TPA: hypothetical protein VKA15_12720, partial [Isosphaeraceae bacterium]|nr:hypothetical protein [Isosphaeraceae bacterium]
PTYCVIFVLERLGLATQVIEPRAVRRARRRGARGADQPVSIRRGSDRVLFDLPSTTEPHRAVRRRIGDDGGSGE